MSETREAYEYRSADLREGQAGIAGGDIQKGELCSWDGKVLRSMKEPRGGQPANVAAVELLQKRVARLEARLDHEDIQKYNVRLDVLESWKAEVDPYAPYMKLDRDATPDVADSSIAYYEQQIEEMSAKWQKADQDRQYAEDRYQLWMNRDIAAEEKVCDLTGKIEDHREQWEHQCAVIADLREKIGSRDAVIADKNRELAIEREHTAQQSACADMYRKERDESCDARVADAHRLQQDAKLGALVRQMPKEFSLSNHKNGWTAYDPSTYVSPIGYDTPEKALERIGE